MRNPIWNSELWEEFYLNSSAFVLYATVHYANGASEAFTAEDFVENSFNFSEHSCGISTFSVNDVYSAELRITLNNRSNRIGYRNFKDAIIAFELRLTNVRTEDENCDLKMPQLIVTSSEYRGEYIELTAVDYVSSLDGKQTVAHEGGSLSDCAYEMGQALWDYPTYLGIKMTDIPGASSLTIPYVSFSTPLSVREFLSACAEIAGCMTVLEYGKNYLTGRLFPLYDFTDDLDGGSFDYDDGDFAYGGEFYGSVGQNLFPVKGISDGDNCYTEVYGNGITWKYYMDGTVIADGTAITDCDFDLTHLFSFPTYQDILTISAGADGCTRSTYYIYGTVGNDESDEVGLDSVTTSGSAFNGSSDVINAGGYAYFGSLYLRICAGVTVQNLTFQPSVSCQEHTNLLVPYTLTSVTNRGITFTKTTASEGNIACRVQGTATSNFPQATLCEGRTLSAGTYTLFDVVGNSSICVGIFLYNNAAMTQKYTGEYTGLNSNASSVYVYTTSDGDLTTSSRTGVMKSFTISQTAYFRVICATIGTGHSGYLDSSAVPRLYTGEWRYVIRSPYYIDRINQYSTRNLFIYRGNLESTYQSDLPFYNCVNGENGLTINYGYPDYVVRGTAFEDLSLPLAEEFYIPENDYILKTNYVASDAKPVLRIIDSQTDEVIYEGTDATEQLSLDNGYYTGYLLITEDVDYGDCSIRPTLMDKKQSESLGGSDEYWAGGWTTLPAYDGGLFLFWKATRTVIKKSEAYPLIKIMQNPIVSPTLLTVTGVEVSGTGITTVKVGTDGYVIKIKDNPLITTQAVAQNVATLCLRNMEGVSFVPFSISNSANPRLEPGDMVIFQDVNGNDIVTFPTGVDYHLGNLTTANLVEQNANENSKFSS